MASWLGGKQSSPETRNREKQRLLSFSEAEGQQGELEAWIAESTEGWAAVLASQVPSTEIPPEESFSKQRATQPYSMGSPLEAIP